MANLTQQVVHASIMKIEEDLMIRSKHRKPVSVALAILFSGSCLSLCGQPASGLTDKDEFSRLEFVAAVVEARDIAVARGRDVKTKCANPQAVKERFDEVKASYSGWVAAVADAIEVGDKKGLKSPAYRERGKRAQAEINAFRKAAQAGLVNCSPTEPKKGLPAALAFADFGFKIFDMIDKRIKGNRIEEQKRAAALLRQTLAWPTWESI